jgi:hypothetical protein
MIKKIIGWIILSILCIFPFIHIYINKGLAETIASFIYVIICMGCIGLLILGVYLTGMIDW